jgi:hypothetical protein
MYVNQQTLLKFTKAILSPSSKLLFKQEPQVFLITSEVKTEIANTLICVKSAISKDENG